jgi:hypothetical protein
MNCFSDALICTAAADVLRHDFIDLLVRRMGATLKKRSRFHDHARLAEAALRHVLVNPCRLAGMLTGGRETFNRSEAFVGCRTDRYLAGANGCAVFMDCASAAYTNATSVLCSAKSEFVAQNPEQRRVGLSDDLLELAINMERILRHCEKPAQFDALVGTTLAAW